MAKKINTTENNENEESQTTQNVEVSDKLPAKELSKKEKIREHIKSFKKK